MSRARASALRRPRSEQQLRQLPHAVGRQAPADPLAGDEAHALRLLAHLRERVLVGLEVELRDEPQAAHDSQGVLGEAAGRDGSQDPGAQIFPAPVGIDERPVREAPRHRIDGEVAAREIFLDRRGRVDDDLEIVPPGAGRALAARRRELDARTRELPQLGVAR